MCMPITFFGEGGREGYRAAGFKGSKLIYVEYVPDYRGSVPEATKERFRDLVSGFSAQMKVYELWFFSGEEGKDLKGVQYELNPFAIERGLEASAQEA